MLSKNKLSTSPLLKEFLISFVFLLVGSIAVNEHMFSEGLIFKSHDMEAHVTWLIHFSRHIAEGILYPRWLANTNYGYGSPDFVFYPPGVYYIGSVLKLAGIDIQKTITLLFLLASLLAGFSCYVYGRNKWGKKVSLLASLAYITSPYLILNIYRRGALAETFAVALFPLGLFLTDQAFGKPKWRIGLAFFFAALSLTHAPSLLLYTIFWFLYAICCLLKHSWKAVVMTIGSGIVGLGMASFYLLPAVLEKSLVNINIMREVSGGFQDNLIWTPVSFANKFMRTKITDIFTDQLLTILVLIIIIFFCCRQEPKKIKEACIWLIFLGTLSFMMTYPSVKIWQSSRTLQMVQFPWRLMGMFSFGVVAMLAIAINRVLNSKSQLKLIFTLIVAVIFLANASYSYKLSRGAFPGFNNPINLKKAALNPKYNVKYNVIKFALEEKEISQFSQFRGRGEYLPLTPEGIAAKPIPGQPRISILKGEALIKLDQWHSYNRIFNVSATEDTNLKIRTFYYPAWRLYVNDKPYPIIVSDDGTIELKLNPGDYTVRLFYSWTYPFLVGVIISIFSIIILASYWYKFA
ncbi:MAG: hypothetical protein F6K23_16480 [Okeania sp. SIO2C9]|uniref:6-pyruvoyl-tetrahydropterin synthase-related protein n=1 Tax=Okeania sp. SIO2C9 TaxID=2607791 RepID=UPI0013BFA6B8|nr:6-pyruvoyl-tetrahydropterin synthase-related protein [Okeania sp. SIO2C9]NEQ74488.1 hypothetical protein [Okeania sp. SIO2C9]